MRHRRSTAITAPQRVTSLDRRPAFTLIELLVSIAIVAMLISVLLTAVQSARESSRQVVCLNNARQVTLATIVRAESQNGVLPATWRTANPAPWDNFSWRATILPFMEHQALYDQLDFDYSPLDEENRPAVEQQVSLFECPSTPDSPRYVQSLGDEDNVYPLMGGAHDLAAIYLVVSPHRELIFGGAWYGGPRIRLPIHIQIQELRPDTGTAQLRSLPAQLRSVVDGLSKTALVVEQAGKPIARGPDAEDDPHPPMEGAWATCDYGSFRGRGINTHNFFDPFGFHRGAVVALCDGSAVVLSEAISREIIVAILSRNGSEIVSTADWQ